MQVKCDAASKSRDITVGKSNSGRIKPRTSTETMQAEVRGVFRSLIIVRRASDLSRIIGSWQKSGQSQHAPNAKRAYVNESLSLSLVDFDFVFVYEIFCL